MDGFNTMRTIACAAALISGCNLFTDLDRFEEPKASDGVPGCESPQTLCLRLARFGIHETQLVGVDLVSADHILRSRALLDPLSDGKPTADIVMPLAIDANEVPAKGEKHPLHLEIFGDWNEDGQYTIEPVDGKQDHDWIVKLPADAHLTFEHSTSYTRLDPRPEPIGGDFHMELSGMAVHKGKMLEVMVIENDSGRAVGLYRMQSIPGDKFEITIPGIIDLGGVVYRVEFYADANDNRKFDGLPTDHTWVRFVESNDKEARATFKHGTDFKPLLYQRTFE
jgi:hypothetical protein